MNMNRKIRRRARRRGARMRYRNRIRRSGGGRSSVSEFVRILTYGLNLNSLQILRIGIGGSMAGNSRITQLCTLYQQYKLMSVSVTTIPLVQSGTAPDPIYVLPNSDLDIEPSRSIILSKGKRCNVTRSTTFTFKSSGRQNDFNYWFDTAKLLDSTNRPTFQLNFSNDDGAGSDQGRYLIDVKVRLMFRYPQSHEPAEYKVTKRLGYVQQETYMEDIKVKAEKVGVLNQSEEDKKEEEINNINENKDVEKEIEILENRLKELNMQKRAPLHIPPAPRFKYKLKAKHIDEGDVSSLPPSVEEEK